MKAPFLALLLACLLAGLVPAQVNLFQNGDFSNGMANWTGSGNGANPQTGLAHDNTPVTENFDTNGSGLNPAFTILPGGNTNQNPNNPPYLLTQQALVMPAPMELHMDFCLTGPNGNAQGAHIKISVAGVEVAAWNELGGAFTAGTYRRHLTFRFTPTVAGPQNVSIEIWRERFIWSWSNPNAHTPKVAIDNIVLLPSISPVLYNGGERKIGGSLDLLLGQGMPNNVALIFLGPGRGPGFSLPGFTGAYALDLAAGIFFLPPGVFDAQGEFAARIPIPNDFALIGATLVFQPLQIAGLAGGNFGHPHDLAFYQ